MNYKSIENFSQRSEEEKNQFGHGLSLWWEDFESKKIADHTHQIAIGVNERSK